MGLGSEWVKPKMESLRMGDDSMQGFPGRGLKQAWGRNYCSVFSKESQWVLREILEMSNKVTATFILLKEEQQNCVNEQIEVH